MGSDSDLPVMQGASEVLDELAIAHELRVLSAHRTPDATREYVMAAPGRGIRVFIAAAGGAAHLAGFVAAHTVLPVIGVPIRTPGLEGVDALYATVQMPSGVPVATVAINGARNAAILAAQILALSDQALVERLRETRSANAKALLAKSDQLARLGAAEYLRRSRR
jgi:5-(carboxyamino)imidazole ribonucleotide mutase